MNIFETRLKKLQLLLASEGCDGFIVDDTVNLYYLTGLQLSAGNLYVDPKGAILSVDGRYFEKCKKESPFPARLIKDRPFPEVSPKRLAFNSSSTYKSFIALQKEINSEMKPLDNPVLKIREIKEKSEIDKLRKAANLGCEGFDYVCTLLRSGVMEADIALELEIFWKRKGSKGAAFDPIIAFGANTSMPHYRAGITTLQIGQPVLIDIGVTLDQYHSDMTRVVFLGEPDSKLEEIYHIVRKAQEGALELCRPGTPIKELDDCARTIIAEAGYKDSFTHSLGHGIGLDVHELPQIRATTEGKLIEGMVLTIEPGIYLPGLGGVRIEDTVVITQNGHENLTKRPKELLKL